MKRFLFVFFILFDIIVVFTYCEMLFSVFKNTDSFPIIIFLGITLPIICYYIFANCYFFRLYIKHIIKISYDNSTIIVFFKKKKKEINKSDIVSIERSKFRSKVFLNYKENGKLKTIAFYDSNNSPFKTENFNYDLLKTALSYDKNINQ